jgi:protein-tyrosine-phosphatase/DNA-binding HxlR family transcriptional regulator
MYIEQSLRDRARTHAALGEPARLAIAEALALGDVSPRQLGDTLGLASNLLAHHVLVLLSAGLVERCPSEADRRRTYLRLLPKAYTLVRPPRQAAPRVVFVCTQNSARSQLAAVLLNARVDVPVTSAGTRPATNVHPRAVAVAQRHGFDLRGARTSHVRRTVRAGDLVVAVCDRAYEETVRSGGLASDVALHWSVPDPAVRDDAQAFADSYDNLAVRVRRLAESIGTREEE